MKDLKHLTDALQTIRLTDEEKKAGRNALLQFMDHHPMAKKAGVFERFFARTRRTLMATGAAFMVLLISTGGITYASESSLPGDLLYDFKVEVVEEVQGAFKFSPEAKAEWDAKRMQRRFDEAEELKNQGKLNPESKFKIKEQMKEHKQEFKDHLEELKNKGNLDRADEMENEFKPLLDQEKKLREEWKPDLQFRPLPTVEDSEDTTEEEVVQEETVEVETEVETQVELPIEQEPTMEEPIKEETDIKPEFELNIEDGLKIN